MTVGEEQFRGVMASFATGVTLVTGADGRGDPVGFTANSVCSVSLDPPLLLFCADRGSQSLAALLETGRFAVSVLAAGDSALAVRFSDAARADRFQDLELRGGATHPPVLDGALAWVRCDVWRTLDAGDHTIVVGEVYECGTDADDAPLVFFGGHFGTFADRPQLPGG